MIAAIAAFISGATLTNCESSAKKSEDAQAKVLDAKQDLKDAQSDASVAAQKAADAEEWRTFKMDTQAKIDANEKYVAEMKAKMKVSGKKMDAVYEKSIDALELRNKNLKVRMEAYEKGQSDWQSFKREFNHDMDELGQAFKDLTVDNKK